MDPEVTTVPSRNRLADRVRADFPILSRRIHDRPLVYLDNAATTQRPDMVLDAVSEQDRRHNANVHRGVHRLSVEATEAFEGARAQIADFLGAERPDEIIFTSGTTAGINLLAYSLSQSFEPGDEILLSAMEHHSNIVPWQMAAERSGAVLRVVPLDAHGDLDLNVFHKLLGPKTKLVTLAHTSNALGTRNPVETISRTTRELGIPLHFDGAQATAHEQLNMVELGCDFFTCSAHKMYGPTGIGVLYGRWAALDALPPWQGGGDMILEVTFEKTTYNVLPHRLEAGTPNITGAVGMAAACRYMESLGRDTIETMERGLLEYAIAQLEDVPGLRLIGYPRRRSSVVSFVLDGIHPHDAGTILDRDGIAIRAGHHCSQPVMDAYGIPATIRASFGVYNNTHDVDALVLGLAGVREMFT
jgi:cysteine desulfurase/selenocysteine lyase